MRLTVIRGAGLGGLVLTTTVDSDSLAPEEAKKLREMVEQADLFNLPERASAPSRQADAFRYKVNVEDGGRLQSVVLDEDALTRRARDLVSWLESVPAREEFIEPAGGDENV